MRKYLIRYGLPSLLSLSLFIATSAKAQHGAFFNAVQAYNPVLYYPLTETVAPPGAKPAGANLGSLGAADNGAYTDGAFPGVPGALAGDADTGGLFSGATGVNPRMAASYDAAYASVTNFTVEIWVKTPTNDPGEECIVNCLDAGATRNGWLIYTDPSGPGTFNFRTYYGNGGTTSVNYNMTVPGGHILANTWYHVVVSYTGATETAQGYINGVAQNPTNSSLGYTGSTAGPFCIGARSDSSFAFPGYIDEVAFYPAVLSSADVANHYTVGTTGPSGAYKTLVQTDNPLLYYRLDEAAAPVAVNYGTAGASANGYYETGTTPGQAGPNYPGLGGGSSLACLFNNPESSDIGPSIPVVGAVGLSVGTATNDPITVTAWVQASLPGFFTTVLGKGDQAYRFDINQGSGAPHWNVGNNAEVVGGDNSADGNWHFWAATWDGASSVYLYIDGALVASSTNGNNKPNGNLQPLELGTAPDDTGRNFIGSLCQVAVIPSALSVGQVQQLYFSAGSLPPELLTQPQPTVAIAGSNATFTVSAIGALPLTYQWFSNSVAIAGATNASFTVSNATADASGSEFSVTVADTNNLQTPSGQAALTVVTSPLPGSYFSSVIALNPLAYYPLNETNAPAPLTEATNIGSLGQSENAPFTDVLVFQTPGLLADSNPADTNFSITTSGSIVEAPYSQALSNQPPFTIELWAQSGSPATEQCPISLVDVGANRAGWLIYMDATAPGVYQFRAFNKNGANTSIALAAATAVNGGENHYLAVVVTTNAGNVVPNANGIYPANSLSAYFYLDGSLSASITNGSYAADDGGDFGGFAMGARSDNAFNFTGALSEVAYYTNALSSTVIASHYAAGTSAAPSPPYYQVVQQSAPVLFYQLDEIPNYPSESSEPVATNYGINGANDNGFYLPGSAPGGVAGPGVGNFPGQGAGNTAVLFNHFTESLNGTGFVDVLSGGGDLNDRGPITMAAWIKPVPNDGRFQTFAGHSDSSYRMDVDTTMNVHFADANSAGDLTGAALNDGNWHFVVGTWDGANEFLYVDGVQNGTQAATGLATGSGDDFTIGVDPQYENSRMFDGGVSELALFNYALSGPQVLSLFYSAGVPPIITNQPVANQVIGNGSTGSIISGAYGTPNLHYSWLKGGVPVSGAEFSGANTSTLTITAAAPGDAGNYSLVVSNNYGAVTSSVDAVAISQSPVIIPALPASLHVLAGTTLILNVGEVGSSPFTNAWYLNGVLVTNGGSISGATTTNLMIANVGPAANGAYVFWVTNAFGNASSATTVFVDSGVTLDDNGLGWTALNNGVSSGQGAVVNNVLTTTDGKNGEITSFFYNSPMWIHAFKASWIYTDVGATGVTNGTADGFAFVIQTEGTNVLQTGGGGSGLGYYQLSNSVELAAELYNNNGNDAPGIDVATNGEGSAGVVAGAGFNYGDTGPVSLISGDPISFNVYYDGSNYDVTLTDVTTGATYSTNYGVGPIWGSDILNSDTAYVGFTSATGGVNATQTFSSFYFVPIISLSVASSAGHVTLSWPEAVGGYVLQQSPDLLHWTTIPAPYTAVNNQFQYTPAPSGTQFYRLTITP
ncbi:MAG TPA: LamG-like jellyroll fold domain-containing protein [Verrucomicrobiae bacterium]|jgi:hypothetical protein